MKKQVLKKLAVKMALLAVLLLLSFSVAFAITVGSTMLICIVNSFIHNDFLYKDMRTALMIIFAASAFLIFVGNMSKMLETANKLMPEDE